MLFKALLRYILLTLMAWTAGQLLAVQPTQDFRFTYLRAEQDAETKAIKVYYNLELKYSDASFIIKATLRCHAYNPDGTITSKGMTTSVYEEGTTFFAGKQELTWNFVDKQPYLFTKDVTITLKAKTIFSYPNINIDEDYWGYTNKTMTITMRNVASTGESNNIYKTVHMPYNITVGRTEISLDEYVEFLTMAYHSGRIALGPNDTIIPTGNTTQDAPIPSAVKVCEWGEDTKIRWADWIDGPWTGAKGNFYLTGDASR